MANRYFVGEGTDTTNWFDTGNWSSTSGGASGASAPGVSDIAIIDDNSPLCGIVIAAGTEVKTQLSVPVLFWAHDYNLSNFYINVGPGGKLTLTGDSDCGQIAVDETAALDISSYTLSVDNLFFYGTWDFDSNGGTIKFRNSDLTTFADISSWLYVEILNEAQLDKFENTTLYIDSLCGSVSEFGIEFINEESITTTETFKFKDIQIVDADIDGVCIFSDFVLECEDLIFDAGDYEEFGANYTWLTNDTDWQGEFRFGWSVPLTIIVNGDFTLTADSGVEFQIEGDAVEPLTIIKRSGKVYATNSSLTNVTAEGGAKFYAYTVDGNTDGGGNSGWEFERIAGAFLPALEVDGEITRPTIEIEGTIQFPSLDATANIRVGEFFGIFDSDIPSITISGYSGGYFSKSTPSIELSASGDTDVIGTLSKAIPRITINTTAHQDGMGPIALTLPAIILSASGFISPVGDFDKEIPAVRLTASAIAGIVGNLEKEIGAIILDASSYWQDENGSVLSMPALRLYAHAQSAIWEMIAVNTKNNGLTNYSNYEYNSLCVMNDQVFGAKSDGIYLLEGDDDNGEDISWSLKTGKIDVENELSQRVRHIWFSRRSSGDLLLIVNDGENEYEYPVTAYSETDDAVRVKLGKGIKSKYLQLELKNIGNETLRLDSFKLFADKRPRQR